MSGIVKSIKKVFKKVVNVAKKVLPVVVMAVAIYFTAGAATGLWGTAVANAVGRLGVSPLITNTITGIVTEAGAGAVKGALWGAGTAAVTGQDIGEGAKFGAITGGLVGGATGGFKGYTNVGDPATGIDYSASGVAERAAGKPGPAVAGGPDQYLFTATDGSGKTVLAPRRTIMPGFARNLGGPVEPSGGFGSIGEAAGTIWKGVNESELAGSAIQGVGTGLTAAAGAAAAADENRRAAQLEVQLQEDRLNRIAQNYSSGAGLLTGAASERGSEGRFGPGRSQGGSYEFDSKTNRIVWFPSATA